jgi:tRNA A-37 threonylcarbamoyl transferase component Bud32
LTVRLLVLGARPDYRLLVKKHVEIEWPKAVVIEQALDEEDLLEPRFAAAGIDAVIIVAAPPTAAAEKLAAELLTKPEFAPIVLVLLDDPPNREPREAAGLERLYGRKVDRQKLIGAISAASRRHAQMLAMLRSNPDFDARYRFGNLMIRGHRIVRQIGSGGMCVIYLAESERAGALVVLKVFSQVPDVSERITGFDRFLQEYQIVAGLKHRNIVRIHDLGVADDHAFIAMEHFSAGDLRQRMKSRLSPSLAVRYLEQIASALEAIHSVGVLHRDLKPANVMLRGDGSLCLIDFGLAKANEMEVSLTGTREIFGTPYYMSPEQGHAEPIDARSDLYSLGVIFYEMLTGRKPYTGASAMEVIYKHKRAEMPQIGPELADYREVLLRLLAKAPEDRFQSAAAVLEAVATLQTPA